MITLEDISTYSLVREIEDKEVQELFKIYEINDYKSLYNALINKIIPATEQILRSFVMAKDLVKKSKSKTVPKLNYFHNSSIDYEINGIDTGINTPICGALNMKNLIYLYTHVDLDGNLCILNYPGIKAKHMKNIRKGIIHYDRKMFPEMLTQKRKIKTRY